MPNEGHAVSTKQLQGQAKEGNKQMLSATRETGMAFSKCCPSSLTCH